MPKAESGGLFNPAPVKTDGEKKPDEKSQISVPKLDGFGQKSLFGAGAQVANKEAAKLPATGE